MKHVNTQGIVLSRTDFDEAARIISFLTPDQGKVRTLARGVRKQKSKLAGGIELFSVSDISYLVGRGDIYTLTSTRLVKHYGGIVKDLDKTNAAYDFLKLVNKNTEDIPEPAYFDLLNDALIALDTPELGVNLVRLWFNAQLLKLAGHMPNLNTDPDGRKLAPASSYIFDQDAMCFKSANGRQGIYSANDIKFLRLVFNRDDLDALKKIQGSAPHLRTCSSLVDSILLGH